jgi:hypothetical protein
MAEYRSFKSAAQAERTPLTAPLRAPTALCSQGNNSRTTAHQFAAPPIIENAAEILARNASHRRKVALPNLLVNHNAAGSDIPTEVFCELEQRPRDPTFE